MSYDHVIYEKRGHVAYVTLNRPERMNALAHRSAAAISSAAGTTSLTKPSR